MRGATSDRFEYCDRARVVTLVVCFGFMMFIFVITKVITPKPAVQLELDSSVSAVKALIDTVCVLKS